MTDKASPIKQLARGTSASSRPSGVRGQRNITPPSPRPNPGGDPNVTPPTLDSSIGPSPDDAVIKTPTSTLFLPTQTQAPKVRKPIAHWLQQGITGSKVSAKLFDGSSTNPKDHLIELEDDSMETEPDVRIYFHLVGRYARGDPDEEPPKAMVDRREWDAQLVREGREYLKSARAQGHGYYVDISRLTEIDIAAKAPPGTKFYRMPAFAIVEDFRTQQLQGMPSEGYFCFDDFKQNDLLVTQNILSNVRIPVWWAGCLLDGVVPGTKGFDTPIEVSYHNVHPIVEMWLGLEKDFTQSRSLVSGHTIHGNEWYDADLCAMVLKRDWPGPDYASDDDLSD